MEITGNEQVTGVRLADGTEIPAEVVLISAGVRPNVELAVKAGLRADPSTGIWVNRHLQTEDPNIFACGDCAAKTSFFRGTPSFIRLASVAATEARIAAANLYHLRRENVGVIGVVSTKVGRFAFSAAGLTEKAARQEGYSVLTAEAVSPNRHPKVMPGMVETKVKLIFERTSGIILGGQIMGGESTGEMANLVATCILHRMTHHQIASFQVGTHPELTAAPLNYPVVMAAETAVLKQCEA